MLILLLGSKLSIGYKGTEILFGFSGSVEFQYL